MAEIGEVYGKDYAQTSKLEKIKYTVKLLASNIANRNFTFRHDSSDMWTNGNMPIEAIKLLLEQVQKINPKFKITYVDKTSAQVNIFPFLINGPVEYFIVTDLSEDRVKIYSLYISPSIMEAF